MQRGRSYCALCSRFKVCISAQSFGEVSSAPTVSPVNCLFVYLYCVCLAGHSQVDQHLLMGHFPVENKKKYLSIYLIRDTTLWLPCSSLTKLYTELYNCLLGGGSAQEHTDRWAAWVDCQWTGASRVCFWPRPNYTGPPQTSKRTEVGFLVPRCTYRSCPLHQGGHFSN